LEEKGFFATLSFKGERFNRQFIPVEALPSISAYQETLVELAKAIWKDENPDKGRLPKNFSKAFKLGLEGIGDGSKVARLPRQEIEDDFFTNDFADIFLEAQDLLASTVSAANNNVDFRALPEKSISPFERLRKLLTVEEFIEVNPLANGKKGVGRFRLTEASVKKVVATSRIRKIKKIEDVGCIVAISETPTNVKIASAHGTFLYPISWTDLRSSQGLSIGSIVSFSIQAETDASNVIRRMLTPIAVSPAIFSPNAIRAIARLEKFACLEESSCHGESAAPNEETIIRCRDVAQFLGRKFEKIRVYPDEEGGIQFEWVSDDISASLLVDCDSFLLGASDLLSTNYKEKKFRGISYALLRDMSNISEFVGRPGANCE